MGWSFDYVDKGKTAKIAELVNSFSPGYTAIAHRVVGNHVWIALRQDETQSISAFLFLIAKQRNAGWGEKGMSEDMGPYHLDCPLPILDLCTETTSKYALEWRKKVRKYHTDKQAKPKLKAGDLVTYGKHTYRLDAQAGPRRGWEVTRLDGMRFRMKANQIAKAVLA